MKHRGWIFLDCHLPHHQIPHHTCSKLSCASTRPCRTHKGLGTWEQSAATMQQGMAQDRQKDLINRLVFLRCMLPESTISLTSMHQTTFLSPFWLKTKRGSVTKQNGYYKCCHWQFCFHIHNKLPSTVLLVWLLRSPIVSQLSCDGTAEPSHNPAKMDFYSWWSILQQISSKFSLVKANTKYSWQGCQEAQGTVTY